MLSDQEVSEINHHNEMNYQAKTDARVENRRSRSLIDVNTLLEHFAIISYPVPIERIRHFIPEPFELWTYRQEGIEYALVSAVSFEDKDFCFPKITKYIKFSFFQTNFRAYIRDKRDNSFAAWFFGTTLGSITSFIPQRIWNMPWKYGQYNFSYNSQNSQYSEYKLSFKSKQGNGKIDIESVSKELQVFSGFKSIEEQTHILTHPIVGYYELNQSQIGTYEIWHPKIDLKMAKANELYFETFERLGLLTRSEMNKPHSVLVTNQIEFDILLPPRKLKESQLSN